MAFGSTARRACVMASLLASSLMASLDKFADAWTAPIIAKGNKFFNSETGEEFRLKGMAYYPRPNAGKMASVGNYDWAADEHQDVWSDHLKQMQDIGVNTIRLYSVDPSKPHDKFMCACAKAGIYVLVGLTAPCENCSIIDELSPKCYPDSLFTRAQLVYNAFAVYDNTLGFSVGNENNLQMRHDAGGAVTAPCVKAFLRDTKKYAASCAGGLRQVPIGLDIADIPPRDQWLQYYDCEIDGDELTRADWIGFNPYVECNPKGNTKYAQSTGLQTLMKEYAAIQYSRPIMFGEFGCNEGENTIDGYESQRSFYDAKWMNEEKEMTDEIVGGNVFEFTTEVMNLQKTKKLTKTKDAGKFGVGYFAPDNCDHDKIPCKFTPYPELENLKAAYTTTKPSKVTLDTFKPTRAEVLQCPKAVSTKLPPTPNGKITLACSVAQPVCSGTKSNTDKGGRPDAGKQAKSDDAKTAKSKKTESSPESSEDTTAEDDATGKEDTTEDKPRPTTTNIQDAATSAGNHRGGDATSTLLVTIASIAIGAALHL